MKYLFFLALFFWFVPHVVFAATAFIKPPNNLGLVGYWPMNEATSTTAGDFSGNGNTGTLSGSTLPQWVPGKFGSALSFNGSSSYVDAGAGSSLNLSSSGTLAAWVKYSASCGSFAEVFGQYDNNNDINGYEIACYPSNSLSLVIANATTPNIVSGGTAYNDGRWHFVVGTWDGSNLNLYVDGVLIAGPSGQTVNAVSNVNNFNIGRDPASGGAFFPGIIDEVRVYNRALTATQVLALYNQGAARVSASTKTLQRGSTLTNGLVGLWTFDGGDTNWTSASAGVVYDGSGNNNIGTLTNMTRSGSPTIGKLGQALSFDGSSSYVDAGSAAMLDNLTSLTACAWVKPSSSGDSPVIIDKSTNGINGWNLYIVFSTSIGLYTPAGDWRQGGGSMTLNAWNHVCGTWDGTDGAGGIILYLNGAALSGGDSTGTGGTLDDNTFNLHIGGGIPSAYVPGVIDDVRVYNRALSAKEVKQLYLLGRTLVKP